jgi:hypothetical protein
MKNGIAMRAKESIEPKSLIITTLKGISSANIKTTEVMIVAIKIGNPKKINRIKTIKTSATLNIIIYLLVVEYSLRTQEYLHR